MAIDSRAPAISLEFGLRLEMETGLPRKTQAFTEVADQQPTFLCETFDDLRIESLKHVAHVGDRCLTLLQRRLKTVEPDLHGPRHHVRSEEHTSELQSLA